MYASQPPLRRLVLYTLQFLLACALFALAFNGFYSPGNISVAGLTGLAQILHAFFPALPVGTTVLVLNLPLFLLAGKRLGKRLLYTSLLAMAGTSLAIDALGALYTFPPLDPMLAAIFGGGLLGLSLGLIFQLGATTGGTDLIARIAKLRLPWLSMGRLVMAADLVVIALAAVVFHSAVGAMYALIALYVSSAVVDGVLYGMDRAKVAYIISHAPEAVTDAISAELGRGVTVLHGTGAYSGQAAQVLMCAFKPRQIVALKRVVSRIDPDAFVVVCDAREVLGLGFGRYREDQL